ncbi:hypothetical protein Poli38472_006808 [Pythium oligandrum]|uniref:WW domain-containing protein n=1 Tax=Pythium oligandrum TaxID=41045 RepID=A0A8K1C5R6_PYTOL|nr:hypothetical protein Poli38472_006808 [Pythium oligandrum]|eukprot:TMW56798.1 hypothetical protein Poli38472_006808 [Pythium oligandrum]
MGDLSSLSPDDIYAKARHFHVDLAAEPYLLPLLKQAAITPLPPQWSCVQDSPSSEVCYQNELTGERQATHPSISYFVRQIHDLRCHYGVTQLPLKEESDPALGRSDTNGWMEFEEPSRKKKYYYDFVSGQRQETHPNALLCDAVASLATGGGLDSADPRVFEHAVGLHKQSSMKHIERLEVLCFTSWWTESVLQGSKKSFLHVYFSIPTKHFQVVLDDSDDVFTISHIIGSSGKVLSAWDLHVGARIQLLGRITTLMQPSLLTRQWLALHEKQFAATKHEVETELLKYELQSHKRKPLTGQIACADPHKSVMGVSLRKLLSEIEELKIKLAKYRPDIARRYVLPLDQGD